MINVEQGKCPHCGGKLRFDVPLRLLKAMPHRRWGLDYWRCTSCGAMTDLYREDMAARGRLGLGKRKNFSEEERARRAARLAELRKRRWLSTDCSQKVGE